MFYLLIIRPHVDKLIGKTKKPFLNYPFLMSSIGSCSHFLNSRYLGQGNSLLVVALCFLLLCLYDKFVFPFILHPCYMTKPLQSFPPHDLILPETYLMTILLIQSLFILPAAHFRNLTLLACSLHLWFQVGLGSLKFLGAGSIILLTSNTWTSTIIVIISLWESKVVLRLLKPNRLAMCCSPEDLYAVCSFWGWP